MWWLGLALVGAVAGSIHDNEIGPPDSLGNLLPPEDPESPNYNSLSPMPYTGGTYHFVSSTFPGKEAIIYLQQLNIFNSQYYWDRGSLSIIITKLNVHNFVIEIKRVHHQNLII